MYGRFAFLEQAFHADALLATRAFAQLLADALEPLEARDRHFRDRGIHCVIVIPTTAGIHGALSLFLHRSGQRHARTGVASGAAAHYRVAVDEGILYSSRHDHDT